MPFQFVSLKKQKNMRNIIQGHLFIVSEKESEFSFIDIYGNQSYKKINLNLKPAVESTPTQTMRKKSGCRNLVPPLANSQAKTGYYIVSFSFSDCECFFFAGSHYLCSLYARLDHWGWTLYRSPRQFVFGPPLLLCCPFVVCSFLWNCLAIFIFICSFFQMSMVIFGNPFVCFVIPTCDI